MESGDIHPFQTLDLNNTSPSTDVHHRQGTTATSVSPFNGRVRSFVRYTTGFSTKRRSPSLSSSTLLEPPTKRAACCHPSAYVTTAAVVGIDGIDNDDDSEATALSTPAKSSPSSTNLQNVLNRSVSETIYSSSLEAGTLRPLPPILPEAESTSPSKSTISPSPPGSDRDSTSADSRRLRRMKEKMKQMNQWIQKVTDDDEEDINQNPMETTNPKKMLGEEETKTNQEAVVVEENGENLILHFSCPCGKGFEIILSGRKCYYRVM